MTVIVSVDCMGGDHGPVVTVPAAVAFLEKQIDCQAILVGLSDRIEAVIQTIPAAQRMLSERRLVLRHASEVVAMDEAPALAIRNKKNSSMRVALDLVKSGEAQACVSSGNTGALMAVSRFVLKMLPGIDRPALCAILPTMQGHVHVLDLGSNVDCSPEHLLQFGIMGSALMSAVEHVERPRVGLLNIGEEDIKGNEVVKRAAELLKASSLNFVGNVEGDALFKGRADIVVCDGFVGNVALKSSEGVAKMISAFLKQEFGRSICTKLAALFALPVLKRLKARVDPSGYNGACLLGLKGVVLKSHGSADAVAFACALERAAETVRGNVLQRIVDRVGGAGSIEEAA